LKFLKSIGVVIAVFILILILGYFLIPKGYVFIQLIRKHGIDIAVGNLRENFTGAEFSDVLLRFKGEEFRIKKAELSGNTFKIYCDNKGYARIKYLPFKTLIFETKNFSGKCIGRKEIGEIKGRVVFVYPESGKGKLYISKIHFFGKDFKAEIELKKKFLILKIPSLHITRKFKIF